MSSVAVAVLLASACTKNETPPPDDAKTTATDKTGAAQDSAGEHAKGPASGSSGDVTQAGLPQLPAAGSINVPTRSGDEEILGHVSVPNGARMMQNVKDHFAVPSISGFLDEQALRNIGASMLGARRDIAFNLDISKPFGCAVVDIKTYSDGPVACTFAYKGGAAQLVKDLGDGGQKPDAGGHTAIYTIEGKDVYVDALGESVVVSLYDPLFKLTSGYLQRNIVERQTAGDIELALYLNYAWDKYGADIKGLLDMAKAMQGSTPEIGVPELDQALAKFQDASDAMTNKNLERLADYEVGVLQLGASPDSVWMDFSFAVKPGTQSAKDAAEYGGRVVDRALLEATPNDAVALIGWSTDLRAADTPTAAEARQALMVAWSSLTGHSAADGEAAVKAFLAEMQTMYTGDGAMALVHHHGTPVAIYMSQKLKAGSGRDAWKAWSQKFTPDAVLGARGAKFVTWSFTPDAGKAGPAAIDRWVIEPTPQAIDEMKLTPEKKAEIEKWIGGLKVTIDRTEAAGHVIWTIAPKAEDAFAARAVAAHNGTGSLKGDAALGKLLSIYPDAATVGGVDVRKGVEWLRSFPELAEEIQLSTPLGVNLADAHLAGVYGKDGRFQARLGISQGFVDQLRALGGK